MNPIEVVQTDVRIAASKTPDGKPGSIELKGDVTVEGKLTVKDGERPRLRGQKNQGDNGKPDFVLPKRSRQDGRCPERICCGRMTVFIKPISSRLAFGIEFQPPVSSFQVIG